MKADVAIIGGGLAGLALAIDLNKRGYQVIVIEKGNYPRHKVCGEYISMESHQYLLKICPALSKLDLPIITDFKLSSTGKKEFTTRLDLGGFGISRYLLEEMLFNEASKNGVVFLLNSKATAVQDDTKSVTSLVITNNGPVHAKIVCNSSGRKSNFETSENSNYRIKTNYVGVKYHVKIKRDPVLIEIHNFPGGYCGISNIEENKSCLCYIVNAKKLNLVNNSIPELEKHFLFQNKNLKQIFSEAEFIFNKPVTISGINFLIKDPVKDDSFHIGDAAGSIAPITGNGMSIALRSASVMAKYTDDYFSQLINKQQLTDKYSSFWNNEFSARIKLSRHFQKLSEYSFLTNMAIGIFNTIPFLANSVIKQTHGKPF